MTKFDRRDGGKPLSVGPQTGIDASNYSDRAKAFAASRGSGFVIRAVDGMSGSANTRQPSTDAQWIAWMAYFDAKSIKRIFWDDYGTGTVPAEWPEDFDVEAPTSDRYALLPRRSIMNRRQRLAWNDLLDGIQTAPRPSWRKDPPKPRTPEQLAADYATAPAVLSDSLRRSMGLDPPQRDAAE